MLPKSIVKGLDKGRLKRLLALFFLALAVPTGILIWQAYGQLKWEAFHQHRIAAEDLTGRINSGLIDMIRIADARSFADFSFLNVAGDTQYNFVQRSPLSAYPVSGDLPGVVGYFQVDPGGSFSTPLLPPAGTAAEKLGIAATEYEARVELAEEILAVLAENRLVNSRADTGARRGGQFSPGEPEGASEYRSQDLEEAVVTGSRQADEMPAAEAQPGGGFRVTAERASAPAPRADSFEDADEIDDVIAPGASGAAPAEIRQYSQQAFDELKQARAQPAAAPATAGNLPSEGRFRDAATDNERVNGPLSSANSIGKVADLQLDAKLQQKSENAELAEDEVRAAADGPASPGRAKRREQIALAESAPAANRQVISNVAGPSDLRISTFESEIDPFEFSLLDSGHFVLFRNVWREGERYIQGLLIDSNAFVSAAIEQEFVDSTVSAMSDLIVGYRDDVIRIARGRVDSSYPGTAGQMQGALLYRSRLSAPLDSLELIFSVTQLPRGPGAVVLGWVTIVLAMVFVGGFVMLYRLGLSQINLARQQQDFVSAVSHELKTPLTSIRMYGEMLREGWADEEKRQDYYEFIHDESERLTRMISNVLQLSNITRNEPSFELKPVNVAELMSNIESKIATQAERGGFSLNFIRDDVAIGATIRIDEDCFAQIVINLVDNAIKFSRDAESKSIDISCRISGDKHVVFAVRDYGPGIPKDQMKKIFRLFYRTESELTRETVGTGIGLAIVHQLTTAMHGKVDVVNTEPGAEFRVSIPQA